MTEVKKCSGCGSNSIDNCRCEVFTPDGERLD